MKETKIYADEFCTTFASTTEMLEFLAERAKQSKWIRKPTRMLKLVPLEKEAETIEEACEKELEGIVEDTEKNTQLVLKVNKDFYPVRDCAIHTILKRAGINGTGLKKLEKATYAKVVNYCLQVAKGDALIKVADGKVSAVHGGGDINRAMDYLGKGTHYVSDLNEPHHASNLTAVNSNHSAFEKYVDKNRTSYTISGNSFSSQIYNDAVSLSVGDLMFSAAKHSKELVDMAQNESTYSNAGNQSVQYAIRTVTQYIYKFGKEVGIY